jgi:hypothetical protein
MVGNAFGTGVECRPHAHRPFESRQSNAIEQGVVKKFWVRDDQPSALTVDQILVKKYAQQFIEENGSGRHGQTGTRRLIQ